MSEQDPQLNTSSESQPSQNEDGETTEPQDGDALVAEPPTSNEDGDERAEGTDDAAPLRSDGDATPRSEVPSGGDASATLGTQHGSENGYFSSIPEEHGYHSPIPQKPRHVPSYMSELSEPSVTHASIATVDFSSQSKSLPRGASPVDPSERPGVHRDLSSISTASSSTVKASDFFPRVGLSKKRSQDYPHYPNQAYSALQHQIHHTSVPHILRTRSSHPYTHTNASQSNIIGEHVHASAEPGSRTAGNSPVGTPGLFTPTSSPHRPSFNTPDAPGSYPSPHLHFTHRQLPKEYVTFQVFPVSFFRYLRRL